jgi:hypothetical protein
MFGVENSKQFITLDECFKLLNAAEITLPDKVIAICFYESMMSRVNPFAKFDSMSGASLPEMV